MAPILTTQSSDQVGAILRGLNLDKTYFYLHVLPTSADGATGRGKTPVRGEPDSPTSVTSDRKRGSGGSINSARNSSGRPGSSENRVKIAEGTAPLVKQSTLPDEIPDFDAPADYTGDRKIPRGSKDPDARPSEGKQKSLVANQEKAAAARRSQRQKTASLSKARGAPGTNPDFDLFLSEKLVPLLAQALDALGRELIRQQTLGDKLDAAVLRRFNPRTWLAQYLIRNDPKAVQTPRRTKVYAEFASWTDIERGRRELLRRREPIRILFMGFTKKNKMSCNDLPKMFKALDQQWWLDGKLRDSPVLPGSYKGIAPDDQWSFEFFWAWFSSLVLKNDVLTFEDFQAGVQRAMKEEELQEKEDRDREEREADERARLAVKEAARVQFVEAATACRENPELKRILESNMILTGAVSSLDADNQPYEIMPYGEHVKLMTKLLRVLGFESLPDPFADSVDQLTAMGGGAAERKDSKQGSKDKPTRGSPEEVKLMQALRNETWWEDPSLTCWQIVQTAMECGVQDGIVDKASLEFATNVEDWEHVRKAVTREREKAEILGLGDIVADVRARLRDEEDAQEAMEEAMAAAKANAMSHKKTFEQLSKEFDLAMVRIEWLHEQFKECLPEGVTDGYPLNPAALSKDKMRELYSDLKPGMSTEEFEQQFEEIDEDGSGEIEFDEFIRWIFLEEIDLEGDEEDEYEEEEA